MNYELSIVSECLAAAFSAEEIFGELSGSLEEKQAQIKSIYYKLAKKTHPDSYALGDKEDANQAFKRLSDFYQEAKKKIANNSYGVKGESGKKIKTKKRSYFDIKSLGSGELSEIYQGIFVGEDGRHRKVFLKMVNNPGDSEFMTREIKVVRELNKAAHDKKRVFKRYLPTVYETFSSSSERGKHICNVFKLYDEYYSLREVRDKYSSGLEGQDIAWIFNRLLEVLGFIHHAGYVHGGISPDHVLIHPISHGIKLIDWTSSVKIGEKVRLMSGEFRDMYPPEIANKQSVGAYTDIYMASALMKYMSSAKLPKEMKAWFDFGTIANKSRRPDDAWQLRDQFEKTLHLLYGGRHYHEFKM